MNKKDIDNLLSQISFLIYNFSVISAIHEDHLSDAGKAIKNLNIVRIVDCAEVVETALMMARDLFKDNEDAIVPIM